MNPPYATVALRHFADTDADNEGRGSRGRGAS